MESKLSTSVMQNVLATCWFFIINMCGTGIKTFLFSYLCHIIDVFSFSFIFFPHWKVDADLLSWLLCIFIKLMNCKPFCVRVFLEFSWKVDVNWVFVIVKSYVKVNFKEIIIRRRIRIKNNNNSIMIIVIIIAGKGFHKVLQIIKWNDPFIFIEFSK